VDSWIDTSKFRSSLGPLHKSISFYGIMALCSLGDGALADLI